MSAAAEARWRSVVGELLRQGRVDLDVLQTYCQVWARWREAESMIAKTGQLVRRPKGGVGANPLIAVSNQAAAQVRALEIRLGIRRDQAPVDDHAEPMSLRKYAKRVGVSPEAVSQAIARHRLHLSVVLVDGKPKIADPELADREWADNTDLSRAPDYVKARAGYVPSQESSNGGPTVAEAAAREKTTRANMAELEYLVKAGRLVSAQDVEFRLVEMVNAAREAILAVPSKFKSLTPTLTHADLAILQQLLTKALEMLAELARAKKGEAA